MLNDQTVLVVEGEFLIALDIQRMLETHGTGRMLFARTAEEAEELEAHWPTVGVAIVETRRDWPHTVALVRRLRDAGVAVVLNTADSALRHGHPDFPDVPVAVKPMAEEDLLAAIEQAVAPKMNGCAS